MDLVGRLKLYMEHVALPISQFADVAMIPRPTLSQILSGRNKKISNELLEKLHIAFPRLNVAWLLFGDGEMENNALPQIAVQNGQKPQSTPVEACQPTLFDNSLKKQTETTHLESEVQVNPATSGVVNHNVSSEPQPTTSSKEDTFGQQTISLNPDSSKKIQTIMVFYNDNSFEIFRPANQ